MGKTLPAHQLESIAEYIAKKFREECEKDKTLKDLIGAKILSRALISPWMNANALPKTQAAFIEMMMMSGDGDDDDDGQKIVKDALEAFKKAREMADKKTMREILSERVDTKVSMQNGKNLFAFNQSQLFAAVESAIFRVFGNTNLAGVSLKRKNCIEYVWWNAQLMFGAMCKKYGIEIEKNDTVGCFVALRKKKQSAMTKFLIKYINHARRQTCTPMPTPGETCGYLKNAGVRYKRSGKYEPKAKKSHYKEGTV